MTTSTATPSTEELLALLEPVRVSVDEGELRVLIEDRGEALGYELWFREGQGRASGLGWLEFCCGPHGELVTKSVSACEVMALAGEGHAERVARITLDIAAPFRGAGCKRGREIAARLEEEVRAGRAGDRVALRGLQARILERLIEGDTVSEICRRGGFIDRRRKPDTSWFERRAGLAWERCSKTSKWRIARTGSPQLIARLGRAVGVDPHELGV